VAATTELGEQLSLLRKTAGLSMDALAAKAGVSRMTVQRIEAGADVRLQTVQDILRVLGMELMLVPRALRQDLQSFVQAQGRLIGQPVGVEAPPSAVEQLRRASAAAAAPPEDEAR
jgi:transcriptional regulator with XRE-family HTH domain